MNHYFQKAKDYIVRKNEMVIGIAVVTVVLLFAIAIVLLVQSSTPKVVYQPAKACDLLTLAEAKELLGASTLNSNATSPVISRNTATSKCGYTDGNPDKNNMVVAAIIVRSGINDDGVKQNKTEFTEGKPTINIETVSDLGDGAYFNNEHGQLNVLDDKNWIIISYGLGSDPIGNTVENAVQLARKVIE